MIGRRYLPGVPQSSDSDPRRDSLLRRIGDVYFQVFHTYRAWWMYILPLAAVVLIPLEVINSVAEHGIDSLETTRWLEAVLLASVTGAISSSSLLGQVFIAGAIGLSLTHARNGKPPRIAWMVRNIRFLRLITVDVLYVIVVLIGLLLLIVPGVAALIFFALVGPAVELENCGARKAFSRSFQLVRSDFWLVFWVLLLAEIVGFLLGESVASLTRYILGEATVVDGIAKGASDVILDPLFAIAAAILAMRLLGLPAPFTSRGHRNT